MANKLHIDRRLLIISGAFVLLVGIASLLFIRQQTKGRANNDISSSEVQTREDGATPAWTTTTTQSVSSSASDQQLQRSIDQAIESSGLSSADWGIYVVSLHDGRVMYARNANRSFIPASNMKLFTTAVALDILGTDYRWRTSVYAASRPDKNGSLEGDLTIYGRGAPDLDLNSNDKKSSLKQLADQIYANGVRHVRGNLIGDTSYFRGEPLGDGWLWNDLQWYFGAEVSALSIGGNEIDVEISPGAKANAPARLKLEPETDFVQVRNDAVTVEDGMPATIGINRGLSDNSFRVWGDFPVKGRGYKVRLAVHQPALWLAKMFRDELRTRGITVDGQTIVNDGRGQKETDKFDPNRNLELASLTSKSLGELTRAINKESLNLEAELVLRTLGKVKGTLAPEPDPRKAANRGDDEAGLAVMRLWLGQSGISIQGISFHDGSGLSRLNVVTPEATGRLLASMSTRSVARVFRDSLPIGGRDGTLHNRLGSTKSIIFAKTGTLNYVNALSGYVVADDKEVLAFSILCNNDQSSPANTRILDTIARLLATYQKR